MFVKLFVLALSIAAIRGQDLEAEATPPPGQCRSADDCASNERCTIAEIRCIRAPCYGFCRSKQCLTVEDCGPHQRCTNDVIRCAAAPCYGECADRPKPGACPALAPDAVGVCVSECEQDTDCHGQMKCCGNGCGSTCRMPVYSFPVKEDECTRDSDCEGECDLSACIPDVACVGRCLRPRRATCPVLPEGITAKCMANATDECEANTDCPKSTQSCCKGLCNKFCHDDAPGEPRDEGKVGTCPAIDLNIAVDCAPEPADECATDFDCTEDHKCCDDHCGKVCKAPIHIEPTEKPGVCPPVPAIACLVAEPDQCAGDADCEGSDKCCADICHRRCKPAMNVFPPPVQGPACNATEDCKPGYTCDRSRVLCLADAPFCEGVCTREGGVIVPPPPPMPPRCETDAECPGGRCDKSTVSCVVGEPCLGWCEIPPPILTGPACNETADCKEGYECDWSRVLCAADAPYCEGLCTMEGPIIAPPLPPAPVCNEDRDCGDGRFCDRSAVSCLAGAPCPGLCTELQTPPEPCSNDGACAHDHYCDRSVVCVTAPCPGQCRPKAREVVLGPGCNVAADCKPGYFCNESVLCVEGRPCAGRCQRECGDNEEKKSCGTACEPSCALAEPLMCTEQCLVDVCQCQEGFVRRESDGRCVKQEECSVEQPKQCGSNEVFTECGSACEPSCAQSGPVACPAVCVMNVCQCAPGYVRDANGRCILRAECPQNECALNEVFKACGTACEPTCDQQGPRMCNRMCVNNVCQCDRGHVRHADGRCVRPSECPRTPSTPPPPTTGKTGMCPIVRPDTAGICVEECSSDDECPGFDRCCSNGCGHQCSPVMLPADETPATVTPKPASTLEQLFLRLLRERFAAVRQRFA